MVPPGVVSAIELADSLLLPVFVDGIDRSWVYEDHPDKPGRTLVAAARVRPALAIADVAMLLTMVYSDALRTGANVARQGWRPSQVTG